LTVSKPLRADDPELAAQVSNEQMRMIFAHMLVGTIIATAFALALAAHLSNRVPLPQVWFWVALKVSIALPRVVHSQRYRRRDPASGDTTWRTTQLLLALDGACWGLAGAALAGAATDLVAEVAASLCCVASVATFGLQVRLAATAAYVVPMIGPTALALLARGDRFGLFAGAGLLMFLALLLTTARRSETQLAETFRLRFLTDRISAERQQALELAHKQSEVKSRFLAAMSHELRTPLHGILGLTRVLRGQHRDPELRHSLSLIEHSGEHLLQLINDLLDTSRIEAGKTDIIDLDFELTAELDELVDMYFVRAQEKGLDLSAHIQLDAPCWVRGDPTRVRQLLHNLLGNAIKFTDAGSVKLDVRRTEAGALEFVVTDTGQGIAPADLPHIFEAFYQTGTHRKRAGGTGLGLAIASDMARAMGGSIRCQSELERGSVFRLTLPLPEVAPPAGAARNDSGWMVGDLGEAPKRVLLAEDNEVNAIVVEAMLAKIGCEVTKVDNGDDAVRLGGAANRRVDLVLMDCQMPVIDGLEATRRIRTREARLGLPRVPVIAVTANTSMDDREACRDAGMDHFLCKPFSERELVSAVTESLRRAP
jgi:signal transduction histidine kinase